MPVLTWARNDAGARPGSRECLEGRVLTSAGYEDTIRWREGDRLEHLYEARCDWLQQHGQADHLAADAGDVTLTYAELDARANQLARFLIRRGVRPGDRIGLLFDGAVDSYVSMLAVLKAHAAYEEKETDVNMAVSLVADTAAAASDLALIVSADSDLCPAIRTARLLGQSRGVIAAFPPRRSSFEIRSLIPRAFTIAAADLRNSLLPDSVIDPATGRVHKRPGKWR